ncbi:hypothetical protein GIB67_020948 [Kingdonia uniflora]|uniref:SWIM-type domain-containing protein n=1 Tax=Kingdonia uniflora TaxID=39325 RepID=A0A7J7M7K9_9MAGN|nr:hypothetical protein GIB67_020948 [Kingdonia uniflora]
MDVWYVASARDVDIPPVGSYADVWRGINKGTLLATTTLDANNAIFSIAFSVVSREMAADWTWFITTLRETIGEEYDHSSLVFVSDRNPSIISTVGEIFGSVRHAYCLKHLKENLKSFLRGPQLSKAAKDMISVLGARSMPVFGLADSIRKKVMQLYYERRVLQWEAPVGSAIESKLLDFVHECENYTVHYSGVDQYEIRFEAISRETWLECRWCSCRETEFTRLPCKHQFVIMKRLGHNLYPYVENWCRWEWQDTIYELPINAMDSTNMPTMDEVLADLEHDNIMPPVGRRPGQPKGKRHELVSVNVHQLHCSGCDVVRQNWRRCTEPVNDPIHVANAVLSLQAMFEAFNVDDKLNFHQTLFISKKYELSLWMRAL